MDDEQVRQSAERLSRRAVVALSAEPVDWAAFSAAFQPQPDPLTLVAVVHAWARGASLLCDRDEIGRLSLLPRRARERHRRRIWQAAATSDTGALQPAIAAALLLADRQASLVIAWYGHTFTHALRQCGGYQRVEDINAFLAPFTGRIPAAAQPAVLLVAALAAGRADRARQVLDRVAARPGGDATLLGMDAILHPCLIATIALTRKLTGGNPHPGPDLQDSTTAGMVWAHASGLAALLPPVTRPP